MAKPDSSITNRTVWALAGPIILSNISVPLAGAVDTAVVGRLPGAEYIGAVAIGALIFSFLYWGFGFLRMGTTGFIARAIGAGDDTEIARIILRVLLLAGMFGLIVILGGRFIVSLALNLVDSSEQVELLAAEYAHIRIWSAPATLCIYVLTGVMIGMHNTRQVFALQLVLNLINVGLDILFVPILNFGVAGVAWATVIAEYTAAITGFFLLRKPLLQAFRTIPMKDVCNPGPMMAIMRTNSHIFVRTLCLVFSFALFTAQGARFGELILAANAILLHLQSILAYALDGFAHAAEAMAGSAYGKRDKAAFNRAVRLSTIWAGVLAVIICFIYLTFGHQILGLFSNQQNVLATAADFLPWMIIAPLISFWGFQLDGVFIGVGHTREMRNAMLVSTLGYLGLVWLLMPLWGNHGLFLALSLFMLLRAVTLWYYYPDIGKTISKN